MSLSRREFVAGLGAAAVAGAIPGRKKPRRNHTRAITDEVRMRSTVVTIGGNTPPPVQKMMFGMYCATAPPGSGLNDGQVNGNGHGAAHFDLTRDTYMTNHMRIRRSFNTSLISSWASIGDEAKLAWDTYGIVPMHSFNLGGTTDAAVAAGTHDATINAFFSSGVPDWSYWIWHHEPENDGAGALANFAAAFARFYDVAKAAKPNCYVGTSHLAYQWRLNTPGGSSNLDAWYPTGGKCDFMGADVYVFSWGPSTPLQTNSQTGLEQWHDWAATKGKPLMLTEVGIQNELGSNPGKNDSTRASMFQSVLDWCLDEGYACIMPWHVVKAPEDAGDCHHNWTPSVSYPSFSSPLTTAVWNDFMDAHGANHSRLEQL